MESSGGGGASSSFGGSVVISSGSMGAGFVGSADCEVGLLGSNLRSWSAMCWNSLGLSAGLSGAVSGMGSRVGSGVTVCGDFSEGVGTVTAGDSAMTTVLVLRNSRMPTAESSRP